VETGSHGESDKGAERRYSTRERKVLEEWFRANMVLDAQRGPTGPTLGAKSGLEKGPGVDCMGVVNSTRERQPSSKHGASRTNNVWVTPKAKGKAENRKG
jgi:hypothetical protein